MDVKHNFKQYSNISWESVFYGGNWSTMRKKKRPTTIQ